MSVFISLLLANALVSIKNEKVRGIFQSIYFLPYVTSLVAIGIVWSWLFNSEYGIINFFLEKIGVNPINWLNDPKYAMVALIIFAVWKNLAFNTLILTTGIASINPQYYQAGIKKEAHSFPWQAQAYPLLLRIHKLRSLPQHPDAFRFLKSDPGAPSIHI